MEQRNVAEQPPMPQNDPLPGQSHDLAYARDAKPATSEGQDPTGVEAQAIAQGPRIGHGSAFDRLARTSRPSHERLLTKLHELYESPDPEVREQASVVGAYLLRCEHGRPEEMWPQSWSVLAAEPNEHLSSSAREGRPGVILETTPAPQPEPGATKAGEASGPGGDPTAPAVHAAAAGMAVLHSPTETSGRHQKSDQADKVVALQKQISDAIEALVDAGAWQRMLQIAARFHDYSFGNQVLITAQRPDATRVAGYRAWQQLGRQVRKGERGIAILAPVTIAMKAEAEQSSQSPDQGNAISALDGSESSPAPEGKPKVLQRFKVAHVFDISQTDGDPLPGVPERLTGDADELLWDWLARLVEARGFGLIRTDDGPDGYTSPRTQTVGVRTDVDQAHAVMVLMHELAHIACGHVDADYDYVAHRGLAEVEAQSVAFIMAAAIGMDATAYTTDYIIGWTQGNIDLVRTTAQKVTTVARTLLGDLER